MHSKTPALCSSQEHRAGVVYCFDSDFSSIQRLRGLPILIVLIPALADLVVGPHFVCGGLPVGGVALALLAQVLDAFRGLQVGAVGTGLVHHLLQQFGVFQHRAGTQMVLVEGLAVVVSHEQRAVQNLQNRLVMDVSVGVVDEHTGLSITGRVDVEVVAAAAMQPPTNSPSFWKSMG